MRGKANPLTCPPEVFGIMNFCRLCIKLHKTPKEIDPSLTREENIKMLKYISIILAEADRAEMIEAEKMEKAMKETKGNTGRGDGWVSRPI